MPPVVPRGDAQFLDEPEVFEPHELPTPEVVDVEPTSPEATSNLRIVRQWYMIVQEDTSLMSRGHRIVGQFTPQQVVQNIGALIPEAGGYSRTSPIIQWVGGNLRTFSFQARLFSMHANDSTAADKLQELEYLMEEHPGHGRPPLVSFFWGVAIPDGFPCFVESLGGVSYDEIRDDGSIRGVTLTITLKRWTRFRFELVPQSRMESTPIHIVRHGETYEMIARARYGDPMLGVLLRQKNPRSPMVKKAPAGIADLQQGEEVRIYPIREMKRIPIKPLNHVLRTDNRIAADNRRYFFELRSRETAMLPRR